MPEREREPGSFEWSVKDHIVYACELADRSDAAYGETKEHLAVAGHLHVQLAYAKKELLHR